MKTLVCANICNYLQKGIKWQKGTESGLRGHCPARALNALADGAPAPSPCNLSLQPPGAVAIAIAKAAP